MKLRRRFLLALAVSLAVHLGVLSGPGWRLAMLDEPDEPATIDAHLSEPRPVPVPVRPKPKKPRPAMPAPVRLPPPVETEKVSHDDTPAPVAETLVVPEPPPPVVAAPSPPPREIALPRLARIHYEVTMGDSGFVVGEAIQELRHDGAGYVVSSTAATTGLAGLFRPAKVVNVSEGDILDGGLRPRQFRIERSNGRNESARFDWPAGMVALSGGRVFGLEAGAQDMLSMFCQLPLMPVDSGLVSLPVVTGKKVERYDFAVVGEERIETPRGPLRTIHLRTGPLEGREATDVWLGLEDFRLPVKIRHIDRRGDMFEQIADRIEYDVEAEGRR